MQEQLIKIQRFLNACDALAEGKYITAEKQITEILKAITASKELTDLFSAVTGQFDFPTAKRICLVRPEGAGRGCAYLPVERGELLAFVFCLFVEIDEGIVHLNDFLLRYFYEDGSYTASFALFAERVVRPFREIVRDCFPAVNKLRAGDRLVSKREEVMARASEKIVMERARIARLPLSQKDAEAAEMMLAELSAATGRGDAAEWKALICGYGYFLKDIGGDENTAALFALADEL